MYDAVDIAKYVINKCIDLGRPISNLQLQKILYYIQGEYIRRTNGDTLFENKISAWQYGPVVPDVYYEFNVYSSSDINNKYLTIELPKDIRSIIDPVISEKSKFSAWILVEHTHNELPWMKSYEEGKKNTIELDIMKKFFIK